MDSSLPRQRKQFSSKVEDHLPELLDALSDHAEFPGLHRQASRFLNSPNSLVGLWQILDNLPEIIEAARQWDSSLIGDLDTIASWVAAIAKIPPGHSFRSIEIISKVVQGKDETGRSFVRASFRGIITDHPVWPVWWFKSGTLNDSLAHASRAQAFRELQAQLLCIHIRIENGAKLRGDRPRIVEAARLLRNIHHPEYGDHLDRWTHPQTPTEAHKFFADHRSQRGNSFRQSYGAFADLLNDVYVLGLSSVFRDHDVIDPGSDFTKSRRTRISTERLYEDHSIFWSAQHHYGPQRDASADSIEWEGPGEEEFDDLIESGVLPEELSSPAGYLYPIDDLLDPSEVAGEKGTLPPLGTLYAVARAKYRSSVMRAQAFTTRRDCPHLSVLIHTFTALQDILNQSLRVASAKSSQLTIETLRLCTVCIAMGAKVSEAIRLIAFTDIAALPDGWTLAYSPEHRVWLRPYLPPKRNPLAHTVFERHVTVRPRIALSDIWSVGARLGAPNSTLSDSMRVSLERFIFSSAS